MQKNSKLLSYEEVKGFRIELQPFYKGKASNFFIATMLNSNIKYLCKKYENVISELIYNQISSQIINALTANKTSSTIELIEYDFNPQRQTYYLFFTFFDSYSLEEILSNPKFQDNVQANLIIAYFLALDIYYLHSSKLMHRSIAPSHILISKSFDSVKLCGHSSICSFQENYPCEEIGEIPFKAPEICSLSKYIHYYNEKVDIYSFGMILFRLFCRNIRIIQSDFTNIKNLPYVPKGIKYFIMKCLQKDAPLRISSSEILNKSIYKYERDIKQQIVSEEEIYKEELKKYQNNSVDERNQNVHNHEDKNNVVKEQNQKENANEDQKNDVA